LRGIVQVKITRLSATEVANISTLPVERRPSALMKIEEPGVAWGYAPVVRSLPSILLADTDLFGDLPKGDDEDLIRRILLECKRGAKQKEANGAVARALIEWRNQHNVRGRVVLHEPLRMSVDSLSYCADVVAIYEGRPWVLNLDCRSSLTLTPAGKEFMKSLIHHTALIGDVRSAGVAILRTPSVGAGTRTTVFEVLEGEPQYSLDDILKRVSETYSVWEMILRSRKGGDEAATGR
jgi:hypothetical protein